MKELEKLLNELISLGRNAFGDNYESGQFILDEYSLNDLCSIDSGLWQFVVDKDLYIKKGYSIEQSNISTIYIRYVGDYEFRIMLSSIQEDKVQFLLDNIKINGKNN